MAAGSFVRWSGADGRGVGGSGDIGESDASFLGAAPWKISSLLGGAGKVGVFVDLCFNPPWRWVCLSLCCCGSSVRRRRCAEVDVKSFVGVGVFCIFGGFPSP